MSKKKFVCVSPISRKAKNRFANEMDQFHSCVVESEENDMLFLASLNKKYFFWVPKKGNDHWRIEK
jgi:hypothetical protein